MQVHGPVERLRVDNVNQDHGDDPSQRKAGYDAEQREQRALQRQHRADLPTHEAEMPQHAEFARARQGLRTETGADAEQADHDRYALEQVGHCEAAIEDFQGDGADLAGLGEGKVFAAGDALAQPLLDLRRAGALLQPQATSVTRRSSVSRR